MSQRNAPFARICTHPGCYALTHDGTSRCPKHPKKAWVKKPGSPSRGTGTHIQKERRRLFQRNPLCVECEKEGRVTLATIRDHIVPLAEGGSDDESNTQGLCFDHHEAKSLAERQRALRGRHPQ